MWQMHIDGHLNDELAKQHCQDELYEALEDQQSQWDMHIMEEQAWQIEADMMQEDDDAQGFECACLWRSHLHIC